MCVYSTVYSRLVRLTAVEGAPLGEALECICHWTINGGEDMDMSTELIRTNVWDALLSSGLVPRQDLGRRTCKLHGTVWFSSVAHSNDHINLMFES
jgi:hypothetical protein